MIKNTQDIKNDETLSARIGREGIFKINAFIIAMIVGGFIFSSCFVSRKTSIRGVSEKTSVVVVRKTLQKIVAKNFDPGIIKEYMALASKTYPGIKSIKLFVNDKLEVASKPGLKIAPNEKTFLNAYAKFFKTGLIVPFDGLQKFDKKSKGYFIPVETMGGRIISASVVFHVVSSVSQLVPFLIAMAIVILGAVAVFFLILLNKGSEYISMRLRFFIIPPILLMLISGYVLLLVQGNAVSTLDTKFAADSSKFLVSKAVMDNGDLESLITAYNKTIDEDQILRFVVMTAGDGTTFIGDHNASKGNMSTPTLLFMLMGTLLVLPFAFGAFIIVDKRVEGIKTFFSYFFICIFVLICMLPVIWIILASFFSEADIKGIVSIINKGEFFTKNFFTLANYEKNLSGGFLTYFKNSLVVSGVTACFCGILGVIAGYAFSRFQFPGRKKQLMWILISQLFPMAMMIVPLYIVSQLLGLSEGLLIIIIAYSATSLPFSIWMMKGYFDTIPIDIEEAAAIDGASTIGRLWHILLPLARPAIATTIFYSFITAWNEFAIASFFLNDDKLRTLPVALNAMLDNFNPQYALFSSAGVLSSLPVVLLFIYLQKHLVSGLTAGGVKG